MFAEIYSMLMITASAATGCLMIYYADKTNRTKNPTQNQFYPVEY
jgi:hypothetical protein